MTIGQCGVQCLQFTTKQAGETRSVVFMPEEHRGGAKVYGEHSRTVRGGPVSQTQGRPIRQAEGRQIEQADVALFPFSQTKASFVISGPGEYDCAGFRIMVIPVVREDSHWKSAVVLSDAECAVGIFDPDTARALKDEHIDAIGTVDVMLYVMPQDRGEKDERMSVKGIEASHQIEPTVLIPYGSRDAVLAALKFLGIKKAEEHTSFRYKRSDAEQEQQHLRVIVLKR